jgi:hypothetical protein
MPGAECGRRPGTPSSTSYTSQQLIAGVGMVLLARNTGTSSDMSERFYGQAKLERTSKELRPEWRRALREGEGRPAVPGPIGPRVSRRGAS